MLKLVKIQESSQTNFQSHTMVPPAKKDRLLWGQKDFSNVRLPGHNTLGRWNKNLIHVITGLTNSLYHSHNQHCRVRVQFDLFLIIFCPFSQLSPVVIVYYAVH